MRGFCRSVKREVGLPSFIVQIIVSWSEVVYVHNRAGQHTCHTTVETFWQAKAEEFKADGISAKNANQMPLTTVQLDGRAAVILVAFSVLLLI